MTTAFLIATIIKVLVLFHMVPIMVSLLTLAERKVSAWIQFRYGPNRVGPWGLFQPIADGLKFFFKEELVPEGANPFLFRIAPALAAGPAMMTVAVIPFTFPILIDGQPFSMAIADINIGVLFFIAMSGLGVYGILLGGWGSNNKWSLLGGLRASAQMISYELSMMMSVITVVMLTGTMNLGEIFSFQGEHTWILFFFPVGTIAFVIFLIAAFAETNRLPFDLAECETELVGGFHTEYSSMKFALFFMGEYSAMFTMSCLLATFFLGGPTFFGLIESIDSLWLRALIGFLVFAAKVGLFLFFYIWVRWTLPRFRWDQLMHLGWKILLPISILNLMATGILIATGVLS
ncbi:MAG TPA: NADH-quinone oxidoreductase subunit NuoH [Planctomycetes bacterium]|nr:NADH-quinone oxidoreductase subunit NuoH [Planctomycetota bacterium]